jgi:hypothetical protein
MAKAEDFASLIEESQRLPSPNSGVPPEIASLFERPTPRDHRVVTDEGGAQIKGAIAYDYQAHVKRFLLPEETHEYEEVLNFILNAEAILRYEERFFTKEGDTVVLVCYLTKKPKPKKADDESKE